MTAPNTSATGGFLTPTTALPAYDLDLEVQVQQTIAGITGLDINLVRPRWQPVPIQQPDRDVNWCAVGATQDSADINPTIIHNVEGDGSDTLYRGEEWTILASFYGPNASGYAALLRDGFGIEQNQYAMRALGLAFVATDRITAVPDFVNTEWILHSDISVRIRRRVARTYLVNSITSVAGTIETDGQSVGGSPYEVTPFQAG